MQAEILAQRQRLSGQEAASRRLQKELFECVQHIQVLHIFLYGTALHGDAESVHARCAISERLIMHATRAYLAAACCLCHVLHLWAQLRLS